VTPSFVSLFLLTCLIILAALALIGQAAWEDSFWFLRRRARNVFAWALAVLISLHYLDTTWNSPGHATCDFGCQWLMGRMFFRQRADELYIIAKQKEVLAEGYQGEELEKLTRDILLKGSRPAEEAVIEGPLYPPIAGLLMTPFAMLEPQAAHAVLTLIYIQLVFLSGLLIRDITGGRLRMGEATLICLVFPNFIGGIVLGQNSSLTLAIITAGWALWGRGRPLLAGLVWGLLAYKPVFAVALIWVPIVLWNWRFLLGMVGAGAVCCLATLPFCGFAPWLRWLEVGKNAAALYSTDRNWIWMSRDLIGLPRREMWDWPHLRNHLELVTAQRDWDFELLQTVQTGEHATFVATIVGLGLLFGVMGLTILVLALTAWWVRRRGVDAMPTAWGPRPAFMLFGALLTVYHIMHYDMQPLALPMCLVLAALDRQGWFSRCFFIAILLLLVYCHMDLGMGIGSTRIPFELLLVLAAWAWTGVLTVVEAARGQKPALALRAGMSAGITAGITDTSSSPAAVYAVSTHPNREPPPDVVRPTPQENC
jgi:hypothetical protein